VLATCYITALPLRFIINRSYKALYEPDWHSQSLFELFGGTLSTTYVLLCWSVLYFGIKFYESQRQQEEAMLKAVALAQQAQLKMLRYQLNPHFLFNTLNAISTLILDNQNRKANHAVTRLSEFLRYTLDQDPMKKVTLRQEIEALDLYLGTERLRFGERLRLEYAIEETALAALVPSLLLQPLLENSLKYAVSAREQGGVVRIEGRARAGLLELAVIDDGPGAARGRPERGASRGGPRQHTRASRGALRRELPLRGAEFQPRAAGRDGAAVRDRSTRGRSAAIPAGGDAACLGSRCVKIRTIIVDDEVLSRRGVEIRLREETDFEILAQCANGREALAAIQQYKPDLVFLDIQMPGISGFEVLAQLPQESLPVVVFVTAYDQYAIKAFEARAIDYLLKPIDEERFAAALQRVREHVRGREAAGQRDQLLRVIAEITGCGELVLDEVLAHGRKALEGRRPEMLPIRQGRETVRVPVASIQWVDAAGDYMCIHAGGETHILRGTMKELEDILDPKLFQRVHRSTIVNLRLVKSLRAHMNGEYFLTLESGHELKLSRTYRDKVEYFLSGSAG
jgi:two-component system LytT family response regulator